MNERYRLAAWLLLLLTITPSCATTGGSSATRTTTAAPAPTESTPTEARATTQLPAATTEPTANQVWTMPNLVGLNLQAAQDAIQALTGNPLFITTSHDATGQHRVQVLDSNWKVCAQSVPPGSTFTTDITIDFGAVKLAEACP